MNTRARIKPGGCSTREFQTREAARDDLAAFDYRDDEAETIRQLWKIRLTPGEIHGSG